MGRRAGSRYTHAGYVRMTKYVRQLQPGQRFMLMRTKDKYTFIGRENKTPCGTRYVVQRDGDSKETTLNHQCVVKPIYTNIDAGEAGK